MGEDEKDLRNAVKNAKTSFYNFKGKKKKLTRKEARHAERVAKKSKQHKFHLKKYGADKPIEPTVQTEVAKKKRKRKKKKKIEPSNETESFDKAAYEAANKADEKLISSLGKKLSGNKKKDHLPAVFKEDGLDYILEVCEPLTVDAKGYNSDEEYLASKSKKRKKDDANSVPNEMSSKEISNKLLFEDDDGADEEDVMNYNEMDDGDELDDDDENIDDGDDDDDYDDGGIFDQTEDNDLEDDDITYNDGSEEEPDGENIDENNECIKEDNVANREESEEVSFKSNKYIPPALRYQKIENEEDKKKIMETRIKKKLKGLLNRVSEGTIPGAVSEIEEMYSNNSRNFMNEVLYEMIFEACVSTSATPEKLVIQNMVIVASLQLLTGSEVASYFLQMLSERFSILHKDFPYGEGKICHNVLHMLISLYNLKVVDCLLIYDLVRACIETFTEKDVSLIFLIVKSCGPDLRKDDPGALKDIIVAFREKCSEYKSEDKSYINFMMEAIDALKNNNIRKIPLYDAAVVEDGRKCLKTVLQGKAKVSDTQLKVSLKDLLDADEKGRWWITGSAWSGRGPAETVETSVTTDTSNDTDFSATVLKAAKKQRMNTNIRKQIFCTMVSSEDYIDAFEKLLKLNFKEKQAREIIHVLFDCCLQEKSYNPFYAHLANKFCDFDKSNVVTLQYSLWDRFKTIPTMKKYSLSNMGKFLAYMVASKSLSLSVLKVVTFGALDKISIDFFSSFFTTFLLQYPQKTIKASFQRISNLPKLSLLRQGVKIFLRHFLYPDDEKKSDEIDMNKEKMKEIIEIAESALDGCDYVPL